jgi:hypothetical protein
MPEVVTHRYDPIRGACRNICSLPEDEALRVLDRLRKESRPKLKADYLYRRLFTEKWLTQAASDVLGRSLESPPVYFFLGDFSYFPDISRPASLVVPVSSLPANAMTFTLGDSMSVAKTAMRCLYTLAELKTVFADESGVASFGLSDKTGFQTRFVEMQLWDGAVMSHSGVMP